MNLKILKYAGLLYFSKSQSSTLCDFTLVSLPVLISEWLWCNKSWMYTLGVATHKAINTKKEETKILLYLCFSIRQSKIREYPYELQNFNILQHF